jgi:hypothetical protein
MSGKYYLIDAETAAKDPLAGRSIYAPNGMPVAIVELDAGQWTLQRQELLQKILDALNQESLK